MIWQSTSLTPSAVSPAAPLQRVIPSPLGRASGALFVAAAVMLMTSIHGPARAAEPPTSPSAQQIIDSLAPAAPRAATPATGPASAPGTASTDSRGGNINGDVAQQRLRNLRPVERRIDLGIAFQFDAATLQPEGQATLNELALAMQSERLRNMRFRIEGHTDAKGSADYNERLSEQRARAAASFLVRQGVEPQRLQAVGKGMREPLPGEDPLSPANRRVRIVAID